MQDHKPKCQYLEVPCHHADCDQFIQRQHLIEHERNCPNQLIDCGFCQEKVKSVNREVYKNKNKNYNYKNLVLNSKIKKKMMKIIHVLEKQ